MMYDFAVKTANENVLQETNFRLSVKTREVEYRNEFSAAQNLCELLSVRFIRPQNYYDSFPLQCCRLFLERDGCNFRTEIKGCIGACMQYMRC